jgi:phosphoglycerol transferase MdoB-like AlkP superfamily enzyme
MDKLRALLVVGPGRSRRPVDLGATAAFAVGGALLIWSAFIHFHLWSETDGYRSIPTIGPLFLLQSITALIIGIGVVAIRRLWAAVIGIGFALTTIAGFLLSVAVGLFGFKESWLAPYAKQAFTIEILAAVVLIAAAALCLVGSVPRARAGTTPAGTAT